MAYPTSPSGPPNPPSPPGSLSPSLSRTPDQAEVPTSTPVVVRVQKKVFNQPPLEGIQLPGVKFYTKPDGRVFEIVLNSASTIAELKSAAASALNVQAAKINCYIGAVSYSDDKKISEIGLKLLNSRIMDLVIL